jgi:Secretion system C-terminal sorting domain
MKFRLTLLFSLLCFSGYSQEQFQNMEFGNSGIACVNVPSETRTMAGLVKVNGEFYGLTGFTNHYIVKLTADGDIVPSFGTNGYSPVNIGFQNEGYQDSHLIVTPDNKLISVVVFEGAFNHNFIAKTNLDGTPETSFGNNGYIATWGTDHIDFTSVEIINNEIVITGVATTNDENMDRYIIVIKYDLNGNPVTSFGDNGRIIIPVDDLTFVQAIHYFPGSNKILILALHSPMENSYSFVAKYDLITKNPDTTFGSNGYIFYTTENDIHTNASAFYFNNTDIYVTGSISSNLGLSEVFIKKYGPDGQQDITYANGGTLLYPIEDIDYFTMQSIDKTEGYITITGSLSPIDTEYDKIFLLRISDNGVPEIAFGNNGLIVSPLELTLFATPYETIIENQNLITVASMSDSCGDESKPSVIQFITGTLATAEHKDSQLGYYPNPVKDILNITSSGQIDKAEVYDLSGKLLNTTTKPEQNKIDLSHLQSGFYMVRIFEQENITNIKIIKE